MMDKPPYDANEYNLRDNIETCHCAIINHDESSIEIYYNNFGGQLHLVKITYNALDEMLCSLTDKTNKRGFATIDYFLKQYKKNDG